MGFLKWGASRVMVSNSPPSPSRLNLYFSESFFSLSRLSFVIFSPSQLSSRPSDETETEAEEAHRMLDEEDEDFKPW